MALTKALFCEGKTLGGGGHFGADSLQLLHMIDRLEGDFPLLLFLTFVCLFVSSSSPLLIIILLLFQK